MLANVKCECGHVNPAGTEICESCGKPFQENSTELLNMRYEGVARRSQVYNKTIIDHIWNFFASVKMAVWMIAITLIASIFGTLMPQQMYIPLNANPYEYYPDEYGTAGYLYVIFGLHNMYASWWFISLIVMIGISLVVCSIDRAVPLHRALKKQRVRRHVGFLTRQRIFGQAEVENPEQALTKAKEFLQKKRYQVREEEQAIMGEKGRFSRWGPYVNHIGLIIVLIGTLFRILPGFSLEDFVWVKDGERVPVPGTNNQFYIESEGFHLEAYNNENFKGINEKIGADQRVVQEFRTEAILYERVEKNGQGDYEFVEVKRHPIRVNDPLVYQRLKLLQYNYRENELNQFLFSVVHKETAKVVGDVSINLQNPEKKYPLSSGYQVELMEYYPDLDFDQKGKPITKSSVPNNPALIFKLTTPENPEGEKSMILMGKTIEDKGIVNQYAFKLKDVQFINVTGLLVRKDLSLLILLCGGIISIIGLSMGFYWQHRRIWFQKEGNEIWMAAHTNKNWFGFQNEIEELIDHTKLKLDKESLDQEVKE